MLYGGGEGGDEVGGIPQPVEGSDLLDEPTVPGPHALDDDSDAPSRESVDDLGDAARARRVEVAHLRQANDHDRDVMQGRQLVERMLGRASEQVTGPDAQQGAVVGHGRQQRSRAAYQTLSLLGIARP